MKNTSIAIALSLILGGSGAAVAAESGGSCAALPNDVAQRDFLATYAQDIEHMKPLKRVKRVGRVEIVKTAGVELYLRPQAGWTAPYVQRMADCQLVRSSATSSATDPFGVPGVTATVSEAPRHIVVRLEAANTEDGPRVLEMARQAVGR